MIIVLHVEREVAGLAGDVDAALGDLSARRVMRRRQSEACGRGERSAATPAKRQKNARVFVGKESESTEPALWSGRTEKPRFRDPDFPRFSRIALSDA